jgi:2-oxoglutarate/2-oxoacid ferredoxin oxidoreductase subunit beta
MTRVKVFSRPEALADRPTHYCPGCGHGVAHRILAEVIDELGIRERTVGVSPVGCSVLAYFYLRVDMAEAAHGRAAAVATGIKRALPDRIVFSYQGDGDLAAIGMAETVHAANRGENITVIFINNAVYGMTGGQMAPTTLIGQRTTTSVLGRDMVSMGPPIRMCELLNTLDKPYYIERVAMDSPAGILRARKAMKTAFAAQVANQGYSFVEILSACPTYQRCTPVESMSFVGQKMAAEFPVRVFRKDGKPVDA